MAISVEIKNIEPMSVGADGAKLIQGPPGPRGERGERGETGADGVGIASAELISGTHAAGTSDTYRITYTDGKIFDFPVYNGADGESGWDGEGAVRYDEAQALTADEKAAACDNIGALPLTGGTLTGELITAEGGFTAERSINISGGYGKGVYIGDTSSGIDTPSLFFSDIEGEERPVRLRNIDSPSDIYDAANKQYVDASTDLFYCTVTGSGTTADPYVCDKTYAEIIAAYSAGKLPVCKHLHWAIYGENNILCIYQSKLSLPGSNADYVSFRCGTDEYEYGVNVFASGKVDTTKSNRNPMMTGATATAAGTEGKVPAPGAGQQGHFLRGDGTWADVSSAVTGFAKIASGTYTGTGTYGADNPNILAFDFEPKLVIMLGYQVKNNKGQVTQYVPMFGRIESVDTADVTVMVPDILTTEYEQRKGFVKGSSYSSLNTCYAKKSTDGKTIYWYDTANSSGQFNTTNYTYYYAAIG